jgi:hypothetical protein
MLADDFTLPLGLQSADETTGNTIFDTYSPLLGEPDILGQGWSLLRKINDRREMAIQCEHLLNTVQEMLLYFQRRGFDLLSIPRLHAFLPDDGSVLFEWNFVDYRIGFTIEPIATDSGWYLVSNKKAGEITASGSLSEPDLNDLISWLFNFVFAHY